MARTAKLEVEIAARKKAEEEKTRILNDLQKEKDKLQALINGIGDEIWFADTRKQFTLANPSALYEFGLNSDANAIDIQKFAESLEVYRPDGSARPVEEAPPLRALAGEVVKNQEEMIRTPATGKIRYRQVSANPVRDADGQIIGSVSVVRDITERKLVEQALQESEEKYREIVDNADIIIIRVDKKGKITFFNNYAQKFFGYSSDEIIGVDVNILVPPVDSNGRNLRMMVADILSDPDRFVENINENILRNGERVCIFWRNKALKDSQGSVIGNLAIGHDITKLKRSDDALRESE